MAKYKLMLKEKRTHLRCRFTLLQQLKTHITTKCIFGIKHEPRINSIDFYGLDESASIFDYHLVERFSSVGRFNGWYAIMAKIPNQSDSLHYGCHNSQPVNPSCVEFYPFSII